MNRLRSTKLKHLYCSELERDMDGVIEYLKELKEQFKNREDLRLIYYNEEFELWGLETPEEAKEREAGENLRLSRREEDEKKTYLRLKEKYGKEDDAH